MMAFLTNATTDRKILKVNITMTSVCILSVQPSTHRNWVNISLRSLTFLDMPVYLCCMGVYFKVQEKLVNIAWYSTGLY